MAQVKIWLWVTLLLIQTIVEQFILQLMYPQQMQQFYKQLMSLLQVLQTLLETD